MINHFIDALVSLFDTSLFYIFLSLFMPKRKYNKYLIGISFFILMIIHITSYIFVMSSSPIKSVLFFLCDFIFTLILFKDKWYKYLLFIILFYIIMLITESTIFSIMNIVYPDFEPNKAFGSYFPQVVFTTFISRTVSVIVISLIRVIKNKPIHRIDWKSLLILPTITAIFGWLIYPKYWTIQDSNIQNLLIIVAIFMFVINLAVFAYIAMVQSSTERYFEMKTAYEYQKQYSSTINTIQKSIRKMAHDIRQHFIYLQSALEQEDVVKAKNYLKQLDENLDNMIPLNVTGFYDIDVLLHAKARIAEKLDVQIKVQGMLPPEVIISPIDLNVLLGNALDNAIEATCKVNEPKEIIATFGYKSPRLNFSISNPYNGQIQKKPDGYFVSQKFNGGLGVEIMNEVVKKYNGALLTEYNEEQFTLTAMLQLSEAMHRDDETIN